MCFLGLVWPSERERGKETEILGVARIEACNYDLFELKIYINFKNRSETFRKILKKVF